MFSTFFTQNNAWQFTVPQTSLEGMESFGQQEDHPG